MATDSDPAPQPYRVNLDAQSERMRAHQAAQELVRRLSESAPCSKWAAVQEQIRRDFERNRNHPNTKPGDDAGR